MNNTFSEDAKFLHSGFSDGEISTRLYMEDECHRCQMSPFAYMFVSMEIQ